MNTNNIEHPSLQNLNRMMKSLGYHVVNTEMLAQASNEDNYTPSSLDNVSARKFIADLILNTPDAFKYLPEVVRTDTAICIDVVAVRPELLGLYKMSIRDDENVIKACLKAEPNIANAVFWSHVSPRLRQRKWIRNRAFKWSPSVFQYFTPTQKMDDIVGKLAFAHSPKLFFYLSETLQNDWRIVSSYLTSEKKTLEYLNVNGYSAALIAKIGTAFTTHESVAKLYNYGMPKNINPPLSNKKKI